MEKSLMLIVAVWLASSPSDAAPTAQETPAEVVETPPKVMTISQLATFNHGKPFLAERDPITGAFDLRTTPVNADDYLYEEFEDSGESIDRKDNGASQTSNHIISIPTKDSELHKFLNLPVHYSSASKFPLISSSYANTKIQGHSASNHRPATSTPSTVQPSYYTHKTAATTTTTTTTTTTLKPSYAPSSTTTARPTTKSSAASSTTSSPPPPSYEYEYEYDYGEPNKPASEPPKNEFSFMDFFNFGSPSSSTTLRPATRATTTGPREPITTRLTTPATTRTTEEPTSPSRPMQTSSTRLPSTTSQLPKVENEPKPSIASSTVRTTSPPSKQESTMIAIMSETASSKNKSEGSPVDQQKEDTRVTEVIGMNPPVKTPDSVMKPPPRFGDRIEPAKTEDGQSGWKGQAGLSPDLYSSKTSSTTPPSYAAHSNGHGRPYGAKPEGSNQIKYSVNRPLESTKKPIEFHQHLVAQVNPAVEEPDEDIDEEPEDTEEQKKPEVVFVVSSTPQASQQASQQPVSTESAASVKPDEPSLEQTNRPLVTFPQSSSSRPQQNYGNSQVYHASVNDDKPLRPPASTYLQRPLIYNQPTQPSKEKNQGQIVTGSVEPDDSVVFNKLSYRPQPGLVSSYQPQQGLLYQQQGRPQQQHQGHPHQVEGQTQQQGFSQPHGSPNFAQKQPIHPQAQQNPPVYHHHKVSPQPFGQPNPPNDGQDEKRPVVWPPKGKPAQDNQKIPPFTFFPRPEQPRPSTAVGTVEPVRPPPRLPANKPASAAISSVTSDTQSYSLQTSFAIGVPSGPGDDSKVAAGTREKVSIPGTVSAVPIGHQPQGPQSHQALGPPQSHPQSLGPPQSQGHQHHPQSPHPHHHHPQQPGVPHASQPVSANTIKYPPPPWEGNLNKPYKEQPLKRKPLPNILPQFRPNAKVGTVESPGPHMMGMNYLREPVDRLQPPPLPRPLHRSDDSQPHQPHQAHYPHQGQPHSQQGHHVFPPVRPVAAYLRAETPVPPSQPPILPPQPVHRRNGVGTKVSTLQMIQSPSPVTRKNEESVMIVYPSNNVDSSQSMKGDSWRRPTPDFSADDEFPHDLDDARKDTPILKGKPPTAKPHQKVEFPYPLEKPLPDGEIKEYQAYTPTTPAQEKAASSDEGLSAHRIQDYHPSMSPTSSSTASSSLSTSSTPPRRIVPAEAEFGWSVIGTRSDEDVTTPVSSSNSGSTSGPMAPPQLTGGFRPIPAPSLD